MAVKNRLMKSVRKYIKKTVENGVDAFSLGYDDGILGRGMSATPPTDKDKKDMRAYSVMLLCFELYKDGYSAGQKVVGNE